MTKKKTAKKKRVIGRTDHMDFPSLNLWDVNVKVDTGAYTSSIHCSNIHVCTLDENEVLSFRLLDEEHELYTGTEIIAERWNKTFVKSSNGIMQERYVILTTGVLFGHERDVELSLTDRTDMKFPVLLGRKALKNRYVVDVAKKNLSFRRKKRTKVD